MTAKEMAERILKIENLKGLIIDLDERKNALYITGLSAATCGLKEASRILGEMGMTVVPTGAIFEGERGESLPAPRELTDQDWIDIGNSDWGMQFDPMVVAAHKRVYGD